MKRRQKFRCRSKSRRRRSRRRPPPAPVTAQRVKGGAPKVEPSWQTNLMRQLQRFKRYPASAQSRKEEGVVLLSFSLDRSGHVLAHSIARSSGHADLDNEVMAMIDARRAAAALPGEHVANADRSDRADPLLAALTCCRNCHSCCRRPTAAAAHNRGRTAGYRVGRHRTASLARFGRTAANPGCRSS